MKQFLSQNGGVLSVLAVVAVLIGGWAEWRISVAVSDKFTESGSVAPHRMDQAEKDIGELKSEDEKLDGKITRIIDILLED